MREKQEWNERKRNEWTNTMNELLKWINKFNEWMNEWMNELKE